MSDSDYEDVIIVNEGYEHRFSASGKERVTIVVKAEPLIFDVGSREFMKGPAEAIAHHFREKIKGIAERAPEATLRARKVAAKAFSDGKAWATQRYGGGRIGSMPPNQSDKSLNDSGRLADSIVANASSDGAWRVNVAANRFGANGTGNRERIMAKIRQLVPEMLDSRLLAGNDIVMAAFKRAQRDMVTKAAATSKNLSIEVAKAALGVVRALVG